MTSPPVSNNSTLHVAFGDAGTSTQWYLPGTDPSALPHPAEGTPAADALLWHFDVPSGGWTGDIQLLNNVWAFSWQDSHLDAPEASAFFNRSAWNSPKNIALAAETDTGLKVSNFVHVDINAVGASDADHAGSTIEVSEAKRGNIVTGEDNDTVSVSPITNGPEWSNDFRITTGAGSDTVHLSTTPNGTDAVLDGQAPIVDGHLTTCYIDMGSGNDFVHAAGSRDLIEGGAGTRDTVFYDKSWQGVTAYLNASGAADPRVGSGGDATGDVLTGVERLVGSYHDDQLFGDSGDNELFGDWGNDILTGGAGHDLIFAGEGDDEILGGNGNDNLFGEGSNDDIHGNAGNDKLSGGDGTDELSGDAGNDDIDGGAGTDTAYFTGNLSDYQITTTGGVTEVKDLRGQNPNETPDDIDHLTNIEILRFADSLSFNSVGSAIPLDGNIHQLTPDLLSQTGAIWSQSEVDLSQSIHWDLQIFLGNQDEFGADGLAFVLQNNGPNVIGPEGGMSGVEGISTAFGFKFDTWTNDDAGDPASDFSRFFRQGESYSPTGFDDVNLHNNLEDGQWHDLQVDWNGQSKTLSYSLDGNLIDSKQHDVVALDFGGDTSAWFGLTAATGAVTNEHMVSDVSMFYV